MPLAAVLIVLLSIALMFLYGVPAVRTRLTDYAETRTFTQAAAAAEALEGVREADLQKELDLSAKTTGGEIMVVDTRGRVVAGADAGGDFEPSREILQTAAAGDRMSDMFEGHNVAVAPILEEGSLRGGIVLASDETQSTAYRLFLRSGLEAAAIASILGGGLMLLLGTLLSRRVERLALSARSIEGGDLSSRIKPGFKDELGDLAETFNAMASKLQNSFAHLESRVAERTAELEGERARLEAILRQMPSGVVIAEAPSGKLILGNEQVERIWRHPFRSAASIEAYPDQYQIFHPDGRPYQLEERPLARSIRTGEVITAEEIGFRRGDGTSGTMWLSSAPIRDREGRIVAGVAVFNDITEQKRIEEARRELEERYRVVVETASDAIVMTDDDSRILFTNGAAERLFGYTAEEMLGRQLTMLMPERLREAHQISLKRYVETGDRHLDWSSTELPGLHKSGKEIPLEVSFGEFIKEGELFFTGFMRDITERKQAEKEIRRLNEDLEQRVEERTAELEQERATLDAILNNLSEGVLAADSGQRVVFANPAARSMLGLSSEEPLEELPDPWEDFDLPGVTARCVEGQGECIEVRVQDRDTLLQVKLEHLPELGDHRGGALMVIQDLSEGRRLETRQQRFLANAAHELKTPITTILGASDLLLTEEEDDPELRRRFLNHIFTEARRMQRLSETLLHLARVGWDLREPESEALDLEAAAREVIWRMVPLAESAGIELSLTGQGARVRADQEWLEQALMVVVSNAVKYSSRGGRIRLHLDGGVVEVEDEGAGISAEDLPHVFDRFYQGQDNSGGFGLGLPICKELIERMGGEISIESEAGVGTTVRIELPEVQDD